VYDDGQKKGWLYKRGNHCFSRFKLKWAVLYDHPVPALYIYDQRDHIEPKYIIKTENIQLQNLEDARKALLENTKEGGFILSTKTRKVRPYCDEWLICSFILLRRACGIAKSG
jgi:hypothetical protein